MYTLALVLSLIGTPGTPLQADTVILIGSRTVDITGDGRAEVLQLVGTGASSDGLAVTFSITSDGQLLYSQWIRPLTRMIGFDGGRGNTSAAEHLRAQGSAENMAKLRIRNEMRRFFARLTGSQPVPSTPPSLPLLEFLRESQEADWLRASMNTFSESVASFLPGHFEAYARVYHPFEHGSDVASPVPSWRELAAAAGADLSDLEAAAEFALSGSGAGQAMVGRLPPLLLPPLVEHLRRATSTKECCYFAVWEGHGDLVSPLALEPTLELPHRRYHVFAGPIDGAYTSFSVVDFAHLSANLWWPADQAWCVATEVDFAWTYVGGARPTIEAILNDSWLEAVETTASARW